MERGARDAVLEPRPGSQRERGGAGREPLVELAVSPAERDDLLARYLERRFSAAGH
jgi:hypothetical protein